MEKVTVLMSAYNHQEFVEEAILSVLGQTYKDFVFLVADDCSTDNTREILLKYENEIDEIHLFDENSGSGRLRQLLELVNTEYVAIINSDDLWENDKLEKQIKFLEEHQDCAACFTWAKMIDDDGKNVQDIVFKKHNCTKEMWMRRFWEMGNCLAHPSILIRTEVYKELILKENIDVYRQLPDFYMWLKLVQRYEIHVIEEKLITFRVHNGNGRENVSAPTKRNFYRDFMEQGMIWYQLMKTMDNQYFKVAFRDIMVDCNSETEEEIRCEKFFVLITAKIQAIAQAAVYYYYDVFKDLKTYRVLQEKYNVNNRIFYDWETKFGAIRMIKNEFESIRNQASKADMQKEKSPMEEENLLKSYHLFCERLLERREELDNIDWETNFEEVSQSIYLEFCNGNESYVAQTWSSYYIEMQKEDMTEVEKLVRIEEVNRVCLGEYERHIKYCNICGEKRFLKPLSPFYEEKRIQYGGKETRPETLNKDAYLCPTCNSFDRDRLIIAYLDKNKCLESGKTILQIAPSEALDKFIRKTNADIEYHTTDLFMDNVTFKSDIQNMDMIEDETYDIWICSHVLEHVKDDRKALKELKRILKKGGRGLLLVPLDLNVTETDEEWGCSEAENWRRFGLGDHSRCYAKEDFIKRLEDTGFRVEYANQEYFGEEVFQKLGFTETSTLYIVYA